MKGYKLRLFQIIFIIVILGLIFLPGYSKIQELRDRSQDLEVKIEKLKAENVLLQRQIERIEKDPIYQEQVLRQKLGVVRPGEVIYKLEPEE